MSAKVNEKILIGWNEVRERLDGFAPKIIRKVLGKAMRGAATEVRDEARRLVPERTGALRKYLGVQTRRTRVPGQGPGARVSIAKGTFVTRVSVKVTSKGVVAKRKFVRVGKAKTFSHEMKITPRNYAHLVEFGTQPHAIRRGISRKTRVGRFYNDIGGVNHPGARPKPFLRPAAIAAKDRAVARAATMIREGVKKEAKTK